MRRGLLFLPGRSGSLRVTTGTAAPRGRRALWLRIGLSLWLLTLSASTAWAQAPVPAHGPNPNFGTYPIGEVGIQLVATGGTGTYTWQVVGGALPPGVSLRTDSHVWPSWIASNTSGMLFGVATTPGLYNFTLRVTSGGISVDQNATIRISNLSVGNVWDLPRGYVGKPYSEPLIPLNATGPVTWTFGSGGTRPAWLTLSPTGVFGGTPTTAGDYSFNVLMTSGGETIFRWINLEIHAVEITSPGWLPAAPFGATYTYTLSGSGGTAPYTFSSNGGLPSGLVLDPSGTISGTSTAGRGVSSFQVTMTDANQVSTWKNLSINTLFPPQQAPRMSLYSNFGDDCTFGWVCERGVSVGGGGTAPFTWTISGQPPGMDLAFRDYLYPNHALIGGTPTQLGTFNIQVTVTDAVGLSTTNVFTIRVSPLVQRFDSFKRVDLTDGLLDVPYSSKVAVAGGVLPYTTAIVGGQLPPGLAFDPATFTVSGTPTAAGSFNVDFEYTDAVGQTLRVRDFLTIDGSQHTTSNGGTIFVSTFHVLGTATNGSNFSRTLTACCAPSYVWTAIDPLPPGLTLSSSGVLSGTPTTNGTYQFVIRVADGQFPAANWAQQRFFLTVASASPFINVTTSSSLPFGNVGSQYSVSLAASGGTGALTWTLARDNFLPPGFALSSNGTLSGMPAHTGQYSFTVNVTDGSLTGSRFFTLFIYAAGANGPLDLSIGSQFASIGQFTMQLSATGGTPPYHYSLTPGAQPVPGMRVQDGQPLPTSFTSTGGFIGVVATPGVFSTSIRVTDSLGATLDRAFTMTVFGLQTLSSNPLPKATVGSPYSFTVQGYGGNGYGWSATNLPPGITINASGQLQGTPTTAGSYSTTFNITDLGTGTSRGINYTLVVDPFAITTAGQLPDGTIGIPYSQTLQAPGCQNCVWTATNIPPGLSFSAGVISGTPTNVNSFRSMTVTATGSNGTVQKQFSISTWSNTPQALSILTASSLQSNVGATPNIGLFPLGGTPPYTWSLDAGSLPPGVSLDGPGETISSFTIPGLMYLTGRAMQPGTFNFTLRLTDALGTTTTRAFTWNITPLAHSYFNLPLTANTLDYGVAYTQPLLGLGGTSNYTWTNLNAMPPGLVLDPTGLVSGQPKDTGSITTQIQLADDAGNTNTSNVTFTIVSPTGTTLVFGRAANLGTAIRGATFNSDLLLGGGTPPYNVTAVTPLPPGLTLLSSASLTSGSGASWFLGGIPLTTGAFTFTLEATDSVGNVGARTFTIAVSPIQIITAGGLANTAIGAAYLQPLIAGGGNGALTWSLATGSTLPPGVTVSPGGVLAGSPTQTGTFTFTLNATDATGNVTSRGFTLVVAGMAITDPEILPIVTTTVPYSYTFSASGGNGPLVWSATGLPQGLTLSPTGTLSGTVSSLSGFIAFNVSVTDGTTTFTRRFATYFASTRDPLLGLTPFVTPLADFIAGSAGFVVLPMPGGGTPPYTWSLAPGSNLPPGVAITSGAHLTPSFNPGQTILVGSPTTPGTYVFDLIATDASGSQIVRTFTVNVSSIGILAGVRTPVAGSLYTQQFTTIGGTAPYSYTMTQLNAFTPMLPTGLSLSPTGLLTGTTTSTGTYQFRLQVTDAMGLVAFRNFTFQIRTTSGLGVFNNGFDDLMLGGAVEEGLSLFGSPAPSSVVWSHVGGTLPPGLSLASDALVGRPTAVGTYVFTLRGSDANNVANFADREFRIRVVPMQIVSPPMRFGWGELPGGHAGQPYSTTIKVAGGVPPYTFAANPLLPLPAGLTLSAAGVLSGTPLQTGAYEIEFDVSDSAGNTASLDDLSLAITPAGVPRPLVRDDGFLGFASRGIEFGNNIGGVDFAVRGGVKPFAWSVTPGSSLPPGLSLLSGGNGVSDMLVGIPTQSGEFDFSLDVVDAAGQTMTVSVELPVFDLSVRPQTIPNGMVGSPYSVTLIPSGGVAPYSIQLTEYSDLPPGLTLSPSGVLSGMPTTAGNFFVAVRVIDSGVSSMDFGYRVTVNNAAGEAKAVRISPYPIQITHAQGSPVSPTAINVNSSSGVPFTAVVSGIPGASLQSTTGTTPTNIAINLGLGSLSLGTYNGFVGIAAPDAANLFDTVPITVNVVTAPPCTYAVNPTGGSVASGLSGGSFSVVTGPGCNWTATKSATWITIVAGASGTGPGNVSFFVSANPAPTSRQGNITVNGAVYSITQFGTSCSFAINPSVINAPFGGGSAVIAVTASSAACAWTASGLNATPAGGTGNGSVSVTIPPNGLPGVAVLNATIAGQTLTVNQTGVGCTVSLGSSVASLPAAGGPGVVQVTAPVGCNYATVTGPSWITVTSGGSGNGTGNAAPLHFDVAPNSTTLARSGSLSIGGQTFQVDQAGLACSVTIDTSGLGSPYGAAGGAGLVGVTTNGSNCGWSASSPAGFASVSPQSGSGNGTVAVTLSSNAGSAAGRATSLTIGGQVISIQQSGTTCTFNLQSADGTVPASGGSGAVGVVAPAVCTWSAVSNNLPWLSITSAGGAGSSTVQFVAQANTSASPRIGTLTVAGLPYTVTQAGAPCSYTLGAANLTVASSGLTSSVSFSTAATGCSPTAVSYTSWITGVGATFNGSSGTVNFTVDPSPFTTTRKGTIQVGDQTFTITQTGGSCGYSLAAYGALFGSAGGNGSVFGSPTALGCVPATGTTQPTIISLSPLGPSVNNIFTQDYAVLPFSSLTPVVRRAQITFGGLVFTVKQSSY